MLLHINQDISATGYISSMKFFWGDVNAFERKIGYHPGRLGSGFFIGHLLRIPELNEFELAGYSNKPSHTFTLPGGQDIRKLKVIAREAMQGLGYKNLVKVFPNTSHNMNMDPDVQYPVGSGIPQWKLVKPLPVHIFRQIEAGYKGNVSFSYA